MRRNLIRHLLGAAVMLTLAAPTAIANDHKHGGGDDGWKHGRPDTAPGHLKHERREERHIVTVPGTTTRIVTRREGLPPGLAKRRTLPPGLARQLRERGELPPGLQKRLGPRSVRFSGPRYTRYYSGRDLVIVDNRTNRIVSVYRVR